MPEGLVSFFIEMLTDPGDLVFDPFAGSNTTGYIAEKLNRNWVAIEINEQYLEQAQLRFNVV
jgi:site-specific DNA-methyltransferase (cytosine-N4-specific)